MGRTLDPEITRTWNIFFSLSLSPGDENQSLFQMDKSQAGETRLEELHGTSAKLYTWDVPMTRAEICKPSSAPERQQEKQTVSQSSMFAESFKAAGSRTHPEEKMPVSSEGRRKYHHQSGLLTSHTGKDLLKCPTWDISNLQKGCHDQYQTIQTGEEQYEISECKKTFNQKHDLIRQQNSHVGKNPYDGVECGKTLSCRKRHEELHTERLRYECSQCGKSLSCRKSLKRHEEIHSGRRCYECSQCGASFRYGRELKKHQGSHMGKRPHGCPWCGQRFGHLGKLKRHLRTHTGEKPFKCSLCGYCFSQKEHLVRHQKIHTGEKHSCSECKRTFSQKEDYIKHQKTPQEESPDKWPNMGSGSGRKTN